VSPQLYGILVYVLIIIAAWLFRESFVNLLPFIMPHLIGAAAGLLALTILLSLVEVLRGRELRQSWRKRLEERDGLPQPAAWWGDMKGMYSRINKFLEEGFQSGLGGVLLSWWRDARFGTQPLTLLLSLFGVIGFGILLGQSLTSSWLLAGFTALLLLVGFFTLTYSRARTQRQLFHDQFPDALDRLADSLQAGFSLPQAIEFIIPNLSQPSSSEMQIMSQQIEIGFTVDEALADLYRRRPSEEVRVLVEGLTLQRQVGGNMAVMMRDMAEIVRKRVELENEVRTMTAQGRLSAVVIALLVPVSLGLLSTFPGYTDVLFNTTIGNLVLITAAVLELIGALIVSRLIRIEV
jgi:tight adherence protein B